MRERFAMPLGFAALALLIWLFWDGDPFCEPIRIAKVIELGGCR